MINSTTLNESCTPLTVRVYNLYSSNVVEKCLLYVYPLRLELYQCYCDSKVTTSSSHYDSSCMFTKGYSSETSSHVEQTDKMESLKLYHLTTFTFSSSLQIVETIDMTSFSSSKALIDDYISSKNTSHEETMNTLKSVQLESCRSPLNTWCFNPLVVCVCCNGEVLFLCYSEELGKFQIRYQYQWNTESAEVPLDNSSNNKPLLGCSFGHAKKADTISIEASYLKLRYALGPFTIEQMTNPANEKKVSNSFIKCGLTVAILLNSECMGILGLMNVFQKASQMEEAELWDSLKKDNPKHNDLNFENSNDLHIDTKPFIVCLKDQFHFSYLIDYCFSDAYYDARISSKSLLCLLVSSAPVSSNYVPLASGNVYILIVSLDTHTKTTILLRRFGNFPSMSFSIKSLCLSIQDYNIGSVEQEISFLSKMPKYLLILSPYTFIIVPLFESNETVDSKNVHITDAVIITHSKCFYSVNLAELCLFTSDARSLDNTKLPIHRLVTVKDLMESSTTFPSYTSCWFLNKPTVDCSFFEIDLRDYHWIIINSLLYLLVPRYKGAVYTVQLVLHPSSLKLYGIHIKPFLKETLYFFCDSPPVLYTSESHHSTCMILLPGHPNEANPPSLWNIQFDYFWGTPPNENSATEQTRVSTSTIESFFWGHRLHTIDPIKILPLLRKSWSPILKSKKDASVLSCNTFLSGSHGNLRKEKLSSGSLGSNGDRLMECFNVLSCNASHVADNFPTDNYFFFSSLTSMTFQYLCFIEPYLGVLKDSCLLSQSRNENDAVSLGMVTGCQSFSKLVEMALCFQCRHTLLGKHEEGSSNVLSFAKTALQFEFPLHMWTFPSVHDVRFPSSTTSTVLVISSDPSKDIGRTQVYLLHNCIDEPSVNCSRSQEPNMLAQVEEITGGFDTDINTIGCGSLYFERESELRDDNNSKECLWIQITPTEIRCLACQSPYSLLQNPVNLLHLNAEECDMTSPYLDIPLGIKGCIVKEFVLVMTESFHIKIWKANSTAYKDLCNNLLTTTCLLNPYTNGTKHLEFMLSQPLECFYLTCLDQLEQNTVLKHIPSVTLIYLVFVCKAKPNTICIVSCDTMEIVFRTEITPFQKHLLNTNKKNEDFLVPFMPMTSHATARIVKVELVALDKGDLGPTLLISFLNGCIFLYRSRVINSTSLHNTSHKNFPFTFTLMDINKMSPLNSFNTTQQIHQRSDTCDFNKMLEDINTSSIYDIDDFLTPLVCNVMSGMSQNLTNGSIWYLRLPVYDETIQKYKTMQGLFVTLTSNKLFMHEHNMTQQMCSFQMPTPFYNSLPLVSWLSLNNKNELQLSFIHFEISTMKAFTFSLMGHSLLAHVKLNIKRCGRIAYDKVTKLLACCDVGFEETISTDFSSNSISQNVNVSSLKIFSLAQFGEQWVQCSKENVPALFPCSEYHLAQNERFCSITFASIQPNVSLIIAGTCLYVDNNSHFVLGNLYMFDCPTFEAIVSNKIVQPLLVRKVQLFPGPILYVGTLSLVNSFPYLVHTAGRKLFVNKMTDNGLTSGCFFDCPWTILSVATVKSYLAVSDGISGLYFLKFRSPVSLSLPTQSLSLLASFPVPISKKYILQGIAVEYTSQQQALYMISCNSEGTLDVLQYSTEQQHATSLQRSPNPFVFKRVTPLLGRVICSPMLHGQGPLVRFHRIETVHPPTMSCIALTLYGTIRHISTKTTSFHKPLAQG